MKRERPPMPRLGVRVQVAERQVTSRDGAAVAKTLRLATSTWGDYLALLLAQLGNGALMHLDHDPALILRDYDPTVSGVAARYTPHAHDPNHLVYRTKEDHQQKTTGRKPGALRTVTTKGSDIGIKTKFARLERKEKLAQTKKMFASRKPNTPSDWAKIIGGERPKQKIQSRGFPKRAK